MPGKTTLDRWYRVRVEARGNTFKMFLDGELVTSGYQEGFPRGRVGLSMNRVSARFRNLKVTDPDGKVLLEGVHNVLPKAKHAGAPTDKGRANFVTPWSDSDVWVVEGQELVQPDKSNGSYLLLFGDPTWTDYNCETDIQFITGHDAGLVFRATGPLNRLNALLFPAAKGIREKSQRGVLARNESGAGVLSMVPGEIAMGRWYRMRIETRGNRFKMFLDGTLLSSVYREGFPRGCVGLVTNPASIRVRNLKVTDPDGKVLLEGVQNILPKLKDARAATGKDRPTLVTPWLGSDVWVVKGQEVHQVDESHNGHVLLLGDPCWTDYDFEAEAELIAGDLNEIGLVFRATEQNDCLYASLGAFSNTRHAVIASRNGASARGQVVGKVTKGRWYRVRVEARGKRFNVFLDGKLLLTGSSDQYPRGCVGLVTNAASARFRNLKVTDPSGKVLLEGVPAVLPKAKDVAYREVGAALQNAVRLKPDDAEVHFALGSFHARWGEWKKAGAEYDRGLELDPTAYDRWCQATVLHLAAGDVEGYRRTRQELVQRYGDADDPLIAERVVNVSLLLPDAVTAADFERVQKLAKRAVTGSEKHPWYRYWMRAKALADYRAGRFAQAVKWLEQSAPNANGNHDDALMFAIQSMAQHGLGRTEEAQTALTKMKTIVARMPDPARGQTLGDWRTWLIVRTVCREAELLLKKK